MEKNSSFLTAKPAGFTLIELLISITILAILSTIALTSFSATQKRGRDAKRRSDMKAIQNAFEQYYGEHNTYNSNCSTMAGAMQAGLITLGPKGEAYSPASCSVDGYCFCASLEIAGKGNSGPNCNFTDATLNYFCVSNLQ